MASVPPFLPPLHVGGPEPGGPFYTHWFLDPKIAVAIFGITAAYLLWVGPLNRRRPGVEHRPVTTREIVMFLLGSLSALVALGPPIDDWAYFFFSSAHMLQHVILMLVSAPLWIAGIPAWVYRPLVRNRLVKSVAQVVLRPLTSFLVANMINAVWHLPVAYNLALRSEFWHSVQHGCFILGGVLIWWPLMSRVPELPRLPDPLRAIYIFAQALPTGIIGAMLTYANPLYPHFAEATVRPWGLGLKQDQVIAGLQMWVGMNVVYMTVATVIFLRWASREEQRDNDALRLKAQRRALHHTVAIKIEPGPGSKPHSLQ